jgi:hypothetical protein
MRAWVFGWSADDRVLEIVQMLTDDIFDAEFVKFGEPQKFPVKFRTALMFLGSVSSLYHISEFHPYIRTLKIRKVRSLDLLSILLSKSGKLNQNHSIYYVFHELCSKQWIFAHHKPHSIDWIHMDKSMYRVCKSYDRWSFSRCGKDLNDLLLLSSIVLSFMFNDPIKAFHLVKEDGLEIFKCQVFPDHCHSLQPSETTGPLFCVSIFQEPEVAKAQIWRIR